MKLRFGGKRRHFPDKIEIAIIIAIVFFTLALLLGVWANAQPTVDDSVEDIIEQLRWKHYPFITMCDISIDPFDYNDWVIYFEDGKFYVETRDGKRRR